VSLSASIPTQHHSAKRHRPDQHRCCASSSPLASQSTQVAFLFRRKPYSTFKPHSTPPDLNQTINATELTRDRHVDNITGATQPVTRSAKSQSPTPKFVQKSTPIPVPRRRNPNAARHQAARYAQLTILERHGQGSRTGSGEI
jgi:hypothetical protein